MTNTAKKIEDCRSIEDDLNAIISDAREFEIKIHGALATVKFARESKMVPQEIADGLSNVFTSLLIWPESFEKKARTAISKAKATA